MCCIQEHTSGPMFSSMNQRDSMDLLGNGDKQCRAILQLKDALNLALAKGLVSNEGRSVVVMQSACQDLTG